MREAPLGAMGVVGVLLGVVAGLGVTAAAAGGVVWPALLVAAAIAATVLARRTDTLAAADPVARGHLNLRVIVLGAGIGLMASAALLGMARLAGWLTIDPWVGIAAAGFMFTTTGWRFLRTYNLRQQALQEAPP